LPPRLLFSAISGSLSKFIVFPPLAAHCLPIRKSLPENRLQKPENYVKIMFDDSSKTDYYDKLPSGRECRYN
jgi:hypothetical protein